MRIETALKETGKATYPMWDEDAFIEIIHSEFIDNKGEPYYCTHLLDDSWEPYHEIKKIQPENVDEVWINSSGKTMIIGEKGVELWCYFSDGMSCPLTTGHHVFHGEGEWTRILPPVSEIPVDEELSEEDEALIRELSGEPEFPFYVKITGCSGENFWYKNKIGNYYKVIGREITDDSEGVFSIIKQYKIDDGISLINLDDCVIVELEVKCRIPH